MALSRILACRLAYLLLLSCATTSLGVSVEIPNMEESTPRNSSDVLLDGELVLAMDFHEPADKILKNKILLSCITGLGLGWLGIDRCFMDHMCLGVVKFLTLGGLGFWWFIDHLILTWNCLSQASSVHVFGFHAEFDSQTHIKYAFWITIVVNMVNIFNSIQGCRRVRAKNTASRRMPIRAQSVTEMTSPAERRPSSGEALRNGKPSVTVKA